MELLTAFIINNFWLLLLMFTFLLCKHYRIGGILILMILIFTGGTIPYWILAIIVIITLFTLYLKPYKLYKNIYNQKIDQFYKQMKVKEKRRRIDHNMKNMEEQEQDE